MTNAKKIEGWIVSGYLHVDDGDVALVQEGIEKAAVYVCDYCEEGEAVMNVKTFMWKARCVLCVPDTSGMICSYCHSSIAHTRVR